MNPNPYESPRDAAGPDVKPLPPIHPGVLVLLGFDAFGVSIGSATLADIVASGGLSDPWCVGLYVIPIAACILALAWAAFDLVANDAA